MIKTCEEYVINEIAEFKKKNDSLAETLFLKYKEIDEKSETIVSLEEKVSKLENVIKFMLKESVLDEDDKYIYSPSSFVCNDEDDKEAFDILKSLMPEKENKNDK